MRRHTDALLAAALFAAALIELLLRDEPHLALQIAVSAVLTGSLVLRRRNLWVVIAAQVAGFAALSAVPAEPAAVAAIPPLLICLYTAGSVLPLRAGLLALAAVSAAVFLNSLVDEDWGDAVYVTTVFVAPAWVGGRLMGGRRRQVEELERLNAALAAERERAGALAAEAERVRIAREMHDVLSHGMSLMVLQAGAGPKLLAADPVAARETFRTIRRTGEQARQELDAALSRRDVDWDLAPAVAAVPSARLRTRGELHALAPGVRLAVQRIVQEGLTNAVKHGGGEIAVDVVCDEGVVDVTVRDGGGTDGPRLPGAGRGLIGMRERAAAYGGSLHAGPRAEGGFEVRARIPAHPG